MQEIATTNKVRDFGAMLEKQAAPKEKETAANDVKKSQGFHIMPLRGDSKRFSREWHPTMEVTKYIGETSMMLQYLQSMERFHKVSMPIKACGIDPIVFEHLSGEMHQDSGAFLFPIHPQDSDDVSEVEGDNSKKTEDPLYELINVDGQLFLSCATESLNEEYVNSVIAEATASIKQWGKYTYQLVCYRRLAVEDDADSAELLNTIRLNTYELSVLVDYMKQFEGITITNSEIDGKECIIFALQRA